MKRFKGTKISTYMKNLNEKIRENKEDILKKAGELKQKGKKVDVKTLLLAVGLFVSGGISGVAFNRALHLKQDAIVENKQDDIKKGDIFEILNPSEIYDGKTYVHVENNEGKTGYIKPNDNMEMYVPYVVNSQITHLNLRNEASVENENVISEMPSGEKIFVYDADNEIYNYNDEYNWKKVIYEKEDNYVEGYAAIDNQYVEKLIDIDEIKCKATRDFELKDNTYVDKYYFNKVQSSENSSNEIKDGVSSSIDEEQVRNSTEYLNIEHATNSNEQINNTQNNSSQEDSEEYDFAIDLSTYSDFENFKAVVDSGKIKSAIFSIGTTNEYNVNFGQQILPDDDNEYSKYNGTDNEWKLIGPKVNQIKEKYDAHKLDNEESYSNTHRNNNIKQLAEYVDYAVKKGIPVGFYYYSLAINTNEASAEAAYIKAVYDKLSADIPEFKDAKKLPITIDIETAHCYERDNCPKERSQAVMELVRLLGKGTNSPDAWCLDGHDPKNGYGVIDKNFILYEDLNLTQFIDRDSIKDTLSKEGYNCYDWYTRQNDACFNGFNMGSYMNLSTYINPNKVLDCINNNPDYNYKYDLVKDGEFFQVFLDQNIDMGSAGIAGYDINFAKKGVFDAMVEGKDIDVNIWEDVEKHIKEVNERNSIENERD